MPRTWRGLPLTTDPRILAKAPTYADFELQQHDMKNRGGFYLPLQPHKELPIAAAMMESLPDVKLMGLGDKFVLWRYPTGLAVQGPSGWTFMMPVELPKKAAGKGGNHASGEPDPAEPVRAKRGSKANS